MNQAPPPNHIKPAATDRAVRLRLLASLVAITAGVAALVLAILLLRTTLG